jgi:uncharacterized protein YndB with AHSA1/START domain
MRAARSMVIAATLLLGAAPAASLAADPPADAPKAAAEEFPGVENTSFVAANGERTMRLSTLIKVPPARVWAALSSAEGWRSWAVKSAYVDFREGGQIETSYREAAPKGDPNNIRNQIIAIVPGRLLVFRNVQAPGGFKDADLFSRIITTIAIEAEGPGTRVTISGAGYAQGPGYDALYKNFTWGNSYSLVALRKSLEK